MTDLALLPCPKPCSECPERDHHWLEDWSEATEERPGKVQLACKHCDATAAICGECLGPILPVVDDSELCQECKNDEDFADVDPVEAAVGPEPMPEDE